MRAMRALAIAAAALGSLCGPAHADQLSGVAEQVCIPEAGYFAVRWYRVYDIDIEAVNTLRNSKRFSFVWAGNPLECRLRGHVVRVTFVPAATGPKKIRHPCQTSYVNSFAITWDGKRLACAADSNSDYERRQSVSITLNGNPRSSSVYAILEQCTVMLKPASGGGGMLADEGKLRCETRLFDPASGKLKT